MMHNKNRRPLNRLPNQAEPPRFCARCGGALTVQHTTSQRTVCRPRTPSPT